jgi:iron complex outermembrane receptor protein
MKWILICCFFPCFLLAQIDSTATRLDSVAITAYRFKDDPERLPYSVSVFRFRESGINNINNKQQLNLDEFLTAIPGLFALNSQNYAQDLRISIRGFGARSAFGIRGIKLIVDGIPETTPDGQGQLDNLNLGIIEQIQILRGPAAILYGNASGGVIDITTLESLERSFVTTSVSGGSYGMNQQQVIAGIKGESGNTFINASRTSTDGFRDRSGFESYNFSLKHKWNTANHRFTALLNYANSPFAQDPGGLNQESVDADRRQSRDRNTLFDTQETVSQFKTGFSHKYQKKAWQWSNYAFYSYRDFEARLPFVDGGAIDLNRNYGGVGTSVDYQTQFKKIRSNSKVGLDYGYQNDLRQRFNNEEGRVTDLNLRQNEIFAALGVYIHERLEYQKWNVVLGARYDSNRLQVDDSFISDGDASDRHNLNAFSTSIGVNYRWKDKKSLYANFSTSFETPVLTELSANPQNIGGFNPDLQPQRAQNYEVGYRVNTTTDRINVALFYIHTSDDLVPYELADFPDRTFFRNAGTTNRYGIEVEYQRQLSQRLSLGGSYTFSDFRYGNYELDGTSLSGNELPAIPQHAASIILSYDDNNLNAQLKTVYRGRLYTNDANTVAEDDFVVFNLSGSYNLVFKKSTLIPFVGINNLFNKQYNDNIRVNAFGGRYFEPAPGINFYAGVRLRL